MSGFQVMGVYPFNRDIFSESDFLSSNTSDRQDPDANLSSADYNISKQTNLNKFCFEGRSAP